MTQVVTAVEKREDEYGQLHASGLHTAGRIILNLWRVLRGELKLPIYTFESCCAAVLRLRTPHVPQWQLTTWFNGGPAGSCRLPPLVSLCHCVTSCHAPLRFDAGFSICRCVTS